MTRQRTYRGPTLEWIVDHVDGISWLDHPAPPKRHEHWAQTTGSSPTGLDVIMRCPCGAFRDYNARGLSDWYNLEPPRVAPRPTIRQMIARLAGRK